MTRGPIPQTLEPTQWSPAPLGEYELLTVAAYVPGTQSRVLVTDLEGPPAQAVELARQIVGEVVNDHAQLQYRVVASQLTADLSPVPLIESSETP